MSHDLSTPQEDFEDLLLGADRPQRPPGTGRRGLAAVLALAMLGLLVLGLAWALSRPAPEAGPPDDGAAQPVGAAPADPAPAEPGPAEPAPAEPGPAEQSPPPEQVLGPSSAQWPVPPSAKHGPRKWSPTQASGFSRSDYGAALAAVNIAGRLDPEQGPRVFRPAVSKQTVGHTTELAAVLEVQYQQYEAALGLRNGEPVPPASTQTPAAPAVGWKARGCRQACVVQLLTPIGETYAVHEIPVVWVDGDWRVRLGSPTHLFEGRTGVDPTGYQPFRK